MKQAAKPCSCRAQHGCLRRESVISRRTVILVAETAPQVCEEAQRASALVELQIRPAAGALTNFTLWIQAEVQNIVWMLCYQVEDQQQSLQAVAVSTTL